MRLLIRHALEVVLDEKWEVPQRIDGDNPYPCIHDQEIRWFKILRSIDLFI